LVSGSAINTVQELEQYAIRANFDFLVQDLIPFQNEGIFYVRYPNEKKGKVLGILIIRNGLASVEELIKLNPRYAAVRGIKARVWY
jgi:hypothetical protein